MKQEKTNTEASAYPGCNFTHGFHRAVQISPKMTATICGDRVQSFEQVEDRVSRLAGALKKLGAKQGDVVAALALNSDRYLEYYLAVPWIGAAVNPINFRWTADEVAYCLNDSGARILFVDDMFSKMVPALQESCKDLETIIFWGDAEMPEGCVSMQSLIDGTEPVQDIGANEDDLFGLFYTGGTTGRSKGVMLSHRNIVTSGFGILGEGAYAQGTIALHAAPMFHLADLMTTICTLLRGGTHVIQPAFNPQELAELVAQHKITDLLLVPVMMQMCLANESFLKADKSSVRGLLYGASPAPQALIDGFLNALPGVAVAQVYGMTETAATNSMLRASDHAMETRTDARMASAGACFMHTRIRIVGDDGTELSRGKVGEITIQGGNVMSGYWNLPEATADALRDGWLWTGDMGYMDDDGYIFIVDRSKDMIISGGENIYSIEVENAVASHPSVASCAVVGIPSDEWGEAVHSFVVLKPDQLLELDELISHCRDKISSYKLPRSISIIDALPISGAGKVLKTELRKPFWEGRGGSI